MIELKISGETMEDFHRDLVLFGRAFLNVGATASATHVPAAAADVIGHAPETAGEEEPKRVRPHARRYGESERGKARRTKEQMAEDQEIDDLCLALGVTDKPDIPATELLLQLREQSAAAEPEEEAKPNISASPEDRKEPETPEALSGEILSDGPKMTAEDVKTALGKVVEKKGMAEAIAWLNKISGVTKFSAIPESKYAEIVAEAEHV